MKNKNISVPLKENSYTVRISEKTWHKFAEEIKKHSQEDQFFCLTNPKVHRFYGKELESQARKASKKIHWIKIPNGEHHKTLETCEKILEELTKRGAHRKSLLVGLGGGVITDIAGFVASIYMRGISYISIPTTLLAQVDASVGGKTGVDLKSGKNLAGSFHQPKAVFIYPEFLKTLTRREFNNGLAEAIKMAALFDEKLFNWISKNHDLIKKQNQQALFKIITRCIELKRNIVIQDEKESGQRALLNFGHTLGHAIEAIENYKKYKHGEAVGMGMAFASKFSEKMNFGKNLSEPLLKTLKLFDLPTNWPKHPKALYRKHLKNDKKSAGSDMINFVVLKKIGKPLIKKVSLNNLTREVKVL